MNKVSLRTCLGCKGVHPKQELLRIVRTADHQVIVDLTGKLSGRGAYLCLEEDCIKKALKGNTIAKALKIEPSSFDKQKLAEMIYKKAGLKNDQKRTKIKSDPDWSGSS